jgi:hypothetical protein
MIVATLLLFSSKPLGEHAPITVFLFTSADGSSLDTAQRKTATMNDLRRQLARTPAVTLVDSPEHADVLLELVSSALGPTTRGGGILVPTVLVAAMTGGKRVSLRGAADEASLTPWRDAAADAGKLMVAWFERELRPSVAGREPKRE